MRLLLLLLLLLLLGRLGPGGCAPPSACRLACAVAVAGELPVSSLLKDGSVRL